jgi:dimethylargininase
MYCEILKQLGLEVIVLPADENYPDCCFPEDTAVVYDNVAIICRLGAKSRRGEEPAVEEVLSKFRPIKRITPSGMLEGGDVLRIDDVTYVGRSRRTNPAGIRQLQTFMPLDQKVVSIPVSAVLHLKTAVNYLGNGYVSFKTGIPKRFFSDYRILQVPKRELQKATFLPIREKVIVPKDCPETIRLLGEAGFDAISIEYSEVRKAQAGLTCASIIF